MASNDLFDIPLLPGLNYRDDIVSETEAQDLIVHIDRSGLTPFRFQQWTGKRLTRSYGWSYDFQTGRFTRSDPIPIWLEPVRKRAADFAGIDPAGLVQALLIRYDPGAGIGWHRDRPVFDHVVGISLGEPATLRFRRRVGKKFERMSKPLAPRSIYHLSDQARHEWEHGISGTDVRRWSITFRSLRND